MKKIMNTQLSRVAAGVGTRLFCVDVKSVRQGRQGRSQGRSGRKGRGER